MIKDFVIVLVLWLGARFAWQVEMPAAYDGLVRVAGEFQTPLLGYAALLIVGLVVAFYLLGMLRWFAPLYVLSRFTFEVSQFLIVLLSVSAVLFRLDVGANLWSGLGATLASVPFLLLGSSCLGFWLFDFNYPLQQRLVRNLVLPLLSALIILLSSLV
ncbi:MAG: hypothetical protein OEV91_07705 [Desulfobulbaceae bacterium]|nr:hypothetical protein [Desulfobulbaceae bacterium]